jgi:DNA-directed RNA polymerase beta' subunit
MKRQALKLPVTTINAVQFNVLGSEEVLTSSSVEMVTSNLYSTRGPEPGSLYDPSFGPNNYNEPCQECGSAKPDCRGHAGHISLSTRIISPMFASYIFRILRFICFNCGKVHLDVKKGKLDALDQKEIVKTLSQMASTKSKHKDVNKSKMLNKFQECIHCKFINPIVSKDPKVSNRYLYVSKDDTSQKILTYDKIYEIFHRIPDEYIAYMGLSKLSHPRNFLINKLYVPPTDIRPTIRRSNKNSNSDMTVMLKSIIITNGTISNIATSEENKKIEDEKVMLNNQVSAYMIGKVQIHKIKNPDKKFTEIFKNQKSVIQRLKGKTKLIRNNLVSKRVSKVCRAVASCDPTLKFDELGIPFKVAKILKIPEVVRQYNYDKLKMCLQNGTHSYPGCTKIGSAGDSSKNIPYKEYIVNDKISSTYVLKDGDTVFRDLMDGDVVSLNREPSLWFASTTTMYIKVIHGSTVKMNPTTNIFQNADFDGDELTILLYTRADAIVEARLTSSANQWIISYQHGKNMVGMFHDSIIGIYLMTHESAKLLTKLEAMSCMSKITGIESLVFDKDFYTGRELVSMILPISLNYKNKPYCHKEIFDDFNIYSESDKKVVIKKGQLISGILDKGTIGQEAENGIFQDIKFESGAWTTVDIAYNMQQLGINYMNIKGATFGVNDLEINETARTNIRNAISANFAQSAEKLKALDEGRIIPPIGTTKEDYNEMLQLKALEQGDDMLLYIMNGIKSIKDNWLYHFIASGSKGQPVHFKALLACIGQTSVLGARIPNTLYGRTNIYYTRFDPDPQARGFNPSCFSEGTRVGTSFFQALETRSELIQTAIGTAEAGDQNRTAVKNLESIIISNMRNTIHNKTILQNLYSGDGLDPRYVENVQIPTIKMNNAEMKSILYYNAEEFKSLVDDRDSYRDEYIEMEDAFSGVINFGDKIRSPFNLEKLMLRVSQDIELTKNTTSLTNDEKLAAINKFLYNFRYVYYSELQKRLNAKVPDFILRALKHKCTYIRSWMNIKTLEQYKISTVAQMNAIFTDIIRKYQSALIAYGKTIGIIAGQCVSQILTQGIIDSKHNSGISVRKISPLERFDEIVKFLPTKKMTNPDMTIHIREDYFAPSDDDNLRKLKVQNIANSIEMLQFSRFIQSIQIFIEQPFKPVYPKYVHESEQIIDYLKITYGLQYPTNVLDWCLRYELNMEEMSYKDISITDIIDFLSDKYPQYYFVHYMNKAKTCYVVRVYLTNKMDVNKINRDVMLTIDEELKQTIVRGISGIKNVIVTEQQINKIDAETGALQSKKCYVIITDGINYDDVIVIYGVDPYRTTTNSIEDTELHFGLESARIKIITEINKIVKGKVNPDHIAIYADEMSYIGKIIPTQRSGMIKRDSNAVMLMTSYQDSQKFLEKGATFAKKDHLFGLSPSLMVGTLPKFGTVYNDVYLDHEKIKKHNTEVLTRTIENL